MGKSSIRHLAVTLAFAATAAAAQDYPAKAVRIISPNATGFAPDIAVRAMADALAKRWNQPVVVEARPGANGFIAIEAAKRAAPDGYTILTAGQPQLAVIPKLFSKVPYEVDDFLPVSTVYRAPFFLAVGAAAPWRSVKDLIAAARAAPGKLTYSSPYLGSPGHMGAALLAHNTGTSMLHVAYKEGSQVYTSVGTGEIDLTFGTAGSVLPMLKAGRIKLLAIASASRVPGYPDVPTVEESGGPPGFEVDVWNAFLVPRGTPPAIVASINAAMTDALKQTELQESLRKIGMTPSSSTPATLAEMIRSDAKIYGDLISRTGIKAE